IRNSREHQTKSLAAYRFACVKATEILANWLNATFRPYRFHLSNVHNVNPVGGNVGFVFGETSLKVTRELWAGAASSVAKCANVNRFERARLSLAPVSVVKLPA